MFVKNSGHCNKNSTNNSGENSQFEVNYLSKFDKHLRLMLKKNYCICPASKKLLYGNWVGCDNKNCGKGWYHVECMQIPEEFQDKLCDIKF